MTNNKLAVLISGSYRNFDSTWKVNQETLNQLNIAYETFFHTWNENPDVSSPVLKLLYSNEFFFSWRKPVFSTYKHLIDRDDILSRFGFRSVQVDKFRTDLVCREFNLDTSPINQMLTSQVNSCGMYLGIEVLRKELELASGFTHFLRLRTDFVLDSRTLHEIFEHDLVFFGQLLPTAEGLIGDQCYGGNLFSGSHALATFDKLKQITRSTPWLLNRAQALGENVMRQTLKPVRQDLDIIFLNGSGAIKRPDVHFEPFVKNPFYLTVIIFHNLRVFFTKVRRRLGFKN
jgi:hypothetical protein